ncbi:unnamed protein product [Notodromas monacha]|uniref:Uncharacterized protein n=1 Tax=Notodromas monacha TaxID=399045 RepID=A0A7R9BWL7_9CRUS|nr:unnamed protein product [Notodromas monacha]CAG0921749.1 unnamed protein product [Notodromas monacha]
MAIIGMLSVICCENLKEISKAHFNNILISMKTDRNTLSGRLELQKRHRDNAEANMESELNGLKAGVEKLLTCNADPKVVDLACSMQTQLEVLDQSASRISSAAEVYGQVQQEDKVSRMMDIFVVDKFDRVAYRRGTARLLSSVKRIHPADLDVFAVALLRLRLYLRLDLPEKAGVEKLLTCNADPKVVDLGTSYVCVELQDLVYGQVQQEDKVSRMMDIVMIYVENQKRNNEKEHAELEELRKLMTTNPAGDGEDFFPSTGMSSSALNGGNSGEDGSRSGRLRTVSVAATAAVRMVGRRVNRKNVYDVPEMKNPAAKRRYTFANGSGSRSLSFPIESIGSKWPVNSGDEDQDRGLSNSRCHPTSQSFLSLFSEHQAVGWDLKQRGGHSKPGGRSVSVSDRCGSPVFGGSSHAAHVSGLIIAESSTPAMTTTMTGGDETAASCGGGLTTACSPIVEEDHVARDRSGSGFPETGGPSSNMHSNASSSDGSSLRHRSDSQQSVHAGHRDSAQPRIGGEASETVSTLMTTGVKN